MLLVRFLQRLIGLCRFRWFSPGNLLYEMVNCTENIVGQGPSSVHYCQLELLIRLVLFQNGYFADVPLDQMLRGQTSEGRNHDLCRDCGAFLSGG